LWKGPTAEQIAELKRHRMPVICDQNEYALKHLDEKTIVGWMHGDEPDNAQDKGKGGYGPPILSTKIVADYKKIIAADPSRPVLLNLGQGVAWDGWYGRGPRTNHPEDYAEYMKGGDVVSFDIYPVNGDAHHPAEVNGKLWLVPFGLDRLVKWGEGRKIVWNCIETTSISGGAKPIPEQVKAEVWMSIIHGSRGIIYFCHSFKPTFVEAGPLADQEMGSALAKINKQITQLAGVINSPTQKDAVTVESSNKDVPVDVCVKFCGATFIFAAAMRDGSTRATFTVRGIPDSRDFKSDVQNPVIIAEVLGEERRIDVTGRQFSDDFKGYEAHLYRIVVGLK